MKKVLTIFVFVFASKFIFGQQQGIYSNFLLHQVVYNPAYMGVFQGKQFNVGYRNQWAGFEGAPKTIGASGYGSLRKKQNVSVGGLVFSEKLGLIDYTSAYAMFAYKLKINEKANINFGLGAGAVQYSVRMFSARPYDLDDNFLSSGVLNSFSLDANAGFYFYTKKFFLGFSNQHMTNSRIRWTNTQGHLVPHYYLYSGYNFYFGKKKEWQVQPSGLLRSSAPVPYIWEANLKTTFKEMIWLSVNYRNRVSIGATAGFTIDKQFSVAYAYDYATSAISVYSGGTHEVLLTYQIPQSRKKSKSEQIQDADEEELKNTNDTKQPSLKGKKENTESPKEQPK